MTTLEEYNPPITVYGWDYAQETPSKAQRLAKVLMDGASIPIFRMRRGGMHEDSLLSEDFYPYATPEEAMRRRLSELEEETAQLIVDLNQTALEIEATNSTRVRLKNLLATTAHE